MPHMDACESLLFDPEYMFGTEFERNLNNYHFFSYNANEELRLESDEMELLGNIMSLIRRELIVSKTHTDRIVQYIRSYMIDRAKTLIASGRNIAEVAYGLGFDYPQHFTRVFKKETGMIPSKYLESLKK